MVWFPNLILLISSHLCNSKKRGTVETRMNSSNKPCTCDKEWFKDEPSFVVKSFEWQGNNHTTWSHEIPLIGWGEKSELRLVMSFNDTRDTTKVRTQSFVMKGRPENIVLTPHRLIKNGLFSTVGSLTFLSHLNDRNRHLSGTLVDQLEMLTLLYQLTY